MSKYIVEFLLSPVDGSEFFYCQADDSDHAVEQCLDAEPGAQVIGVFVEVIR